MWETLKIIATIALFQKNKMDTILVSKNDTHGSIHRTPTWLRLVKKITEARGEVVAQNNSAVFIVQLSILRIDFSSNIRLPRLGRPFEELHKFKPPI